MQCPQCGNNTAPNDRFCQACGAPVENTLNAPPPGTPTGAPYPPAPPAQGPAQPPFQGPAPGMQGMPYPGAPYQPPMGYPPYIQLQPRKTPLVLGIIGAVFALLLPLVTYCCSIPGLVMANRDKNQGKPYVKASIPLNIVAICLAGVNSLLGVLT